MKESEAKEKLENVEQGEEAIKESSHRAYVGGVGDNMNWKYIGLLQFAFLVKQGLRPSHTLMDVACGSLRAGLHFIPFLERGNYFGIDKEEYLIKMGLKNEVDPKVIEDKAPEFVISSAFEFEKFSRKADYAIAQSLFTHLPYDMVGDCLEKLHHHMNINGRFYATYFIAKDKTNNPNEPHDKLGFWFTKAQVIQLGKDAGWAVNFIGDWGHPRGQKIVEYKKVS